MSELILHHYPPSPVSEKIRTALGAKGLAWRSVEQNRLPERPELFAMTGGYRRIPVLQADADIYCESSGCATSPTRGRTRCGSGAAPSVIAAPTLAGQSKGTDSSGV